MRKALDYLTTPDREGLYEVVFFQEHTKFQYPLTSMLWLAPLRSIQGGRFISNAPLNTFSFAVLFGFGMAVGGIFVEALRRMADEGALTRAETIMGFALGLAFTFTFYPAVRGFYLGQIQTWIDALVAAALWSWMRGGRALPGVLTGLACTMKPTLGLLLLWSLFRRHLSFAAGFTAVIAVFGAVSVIAYGASDNVDYLRVVSYISRHGESYFPNQSMNGLLNRMLSNGSNFTFQRDAFAPYHPVVYYGTLISSILLIGTALFYRQRDSRAKELDFAIAMVTLTLASPVVWEHHYGVLLPVFALALIPCLKGWQNGRAAPLLVLAGSFVFVSNIFTLVNYLAETPFNVLQSYVFVAGIALLMLLYQLRRATGGRMGSP